MGPGSDSDVQWRTFLSILARCFPKIELRLHFQPKFRRGAESFGKLKRHLRRDADISIQQPRERNSGNAEMFCELSDRYCSNVFPESLSGMSRVIHAHKQFL